MVRDLAEFGKPDVIINTKKISYVHKRDFSNDDALREENKLLIIIVVCDGARLEFNFLPKDRDKWESCFNLFKKIIYENP
jgi:hypothetical protein